MNLFIGEISSRFYTIGIHGSFQVQYHFNINFGYNFGLVGDSKQQDA